MFARARASSAGHAPARRPRRAPVERPPPRPVAPRQRRRVEPRRGSAGAPRVRATTRSPNAASSSPKDRSTFVDAHGPGGYAATPAALSPCAPCRSHFLGGATTVTGSQYLLVTERAKVLIDCGMFQGSPNESIRNRVPFAFDPAELDAVLLTHAHLDHCGLLPLLVKDGYRGADPRHGRHGRAGDARPARLGQAPRGVRQARGALGEAPPGRGRGRRPARGRRVPGGRRPGRRGRVGDGRGRRHRAPPTHRSRRRRRRLGGRRRGSRARRRRPSKPSTSPATRRRLAARPRGRAARPAAAPRDRPRRAAVHGQGRRGARWRSSRRSHYGEEVEVAPGIHATFVDAGHILGSAIIRLRVQDDGRRRGAVDRLLRRPRPARHADPARPDRR